MKKKDEMTASLATSTYAACKDLLTTFDTSSVDPVLWAVIEERLQAIMVIANAIHVGACGYGINPLNFVSEQNVQPITNETLDKLVREGKVNIVETFGFQDEECQCPKCQERRAMNTPPEKKH